MAGQVPCIYLLLGPKGSGKSYAGRLMEAELNIPFCPVEQWLLELKQSPDLNNDAYLQAVFARIEEGVRTALQSATVVCFESTGLTPWFDGMLASLQQDFRVITIRLQADADVCLNRVEARDASTHLPHSWETVADINRQVAEKNVPAMHTISNSENNREALLKALQAVVKSTASGFQ